MPDLTLADFQDAGYKPPVSEQPLPPLDPIKLAKAGYGAPQEHSTNLADIATGLVGGVIGEASDLIGHGIKNVGTVVGSPGMQDYGQSRIDNAGYLKDIGNQASPTATSVGSIGADIGGALALPGSSVPALAAGGAAAGLATSNGENISQILMDTAKAAAVSGSLATALKAGTMLASKGVKAVGPMLTNIAQGSKIVLTSAEDYANAAVNQTLIRAGGDDLAKATPDSAVDAILSVQKGLKAQAKDLYALRNVAAEDAGIKVAKDNISELYTKTQADMATGVKEGTSEALAAIKKLKGTVDSPISFSKAEDLSSGLGAAINDATKQGNSVVASSLQTVRSTWQADIAKAAEGNSDVMDLHNAATTFYRDSYAPIKNLQTQQQTLNKVTSRKFISDLVSGMDTKLPNTAGYNKLPDETKMQIIGAWTNIQRASSSKTGELDLGQMYKTIEKAKVQNPSLFKVSTVLDDMGTLAKVLQARADVVPKVRAMFNPTTIGFAGLGAAAASLGNPVVGASALAIPIALHLNAAGKMLNNPAARNLLRTMRGLDAYPDSYLAKEAAKKIESSYMNTMGRMPKVVALMGAGSST